MELQILKDNKTSRNELIKSLITLLLIDNALIYSSLKNPTKEGQLISNFLGCKLEILSPYAFHHYSVELNKRIAAQHPRGKSIYLSLEGVKKFSNIINLGYIEPKVEEDILNEIIDFFKETKFTYINVGENFDCFFITTTN